MQTMDIDQDTYEPGFADECDGDQVSCLERAMASLRPDASLACIYESINNIPVPEAFPTDSSIVQCPKNSISRPGNIFSPSEIAFIECSVGSRMTRRQTKAMLKTIKHPSFNPSEISSDVLSKLDRAQMEDIDFEVRFLLVCLSSFYLYK